MDDLISFIRLDQKWSYMSDLSWLCDKALLYWPLDFIAKSLSEQKLFIIILNLFTLLEWSNNELELIMNFCPIYNEI